MWMMGYNDGGDLYMSDSINAGRKLRPLIPRPLTATSTAVSTPPCLNRMIHGAVPDHHLFSLNGSSIAAMSEHSKRGDFNPSQQVVVSTRWNPTPEQLRALEELYRRGTRTPSAEQIQHITAQLRRYGKIEGKNVFYWFQNHKARERQKRRREMGSDDQINQDVEILERKDTGGPSRTMFGVDQQTTTNWPSPINSSTVAEQSAVCIRKAAKAGGGGGSEAAECKSSEHHQWMKMDDGLIGGRELRESQQQLRRNDTWQTMQLSNPDSPAPTHHINTPKPPMDPKMNHLFNKPANNSNVINHPPPPHLTPFLIPSRPPPPFQAYNIGFDQGDEEEDRDHHHHYQHFRHHHFAINNHFMNGDQEDDDDSQTLELFPLRSGDFGYDINGNDKEFAAINNGFTTPHQFFEFLPLKN